MKTPTSLAEDLGNVEGGLLEVEVVGLEDSLLAKGRDAIEEVLARVVYTDGGHLELMLVVQLIDQILHRARAVRVRDHHDRLRPKRLSSDA